MAKIVDRRAEDENEVLIVCDFSPGTGRRPRTDGASLVARRRLYFCRVQPRQIGQGVLDHGRPVGEAGRLRRRRVHPGDARHEQGCPAEPAAWSGAPWTRERRSSQGRPIHRARAGLCRSGRRLYFNRTNCFDSPDERWVRLQGTAPPRTNGTCVSARSSTLGTNSTRS